MAGASAFPCLPRPLYRSVPPHRHHQRKHIPVRKELRAALGRLQLEPPLQVQILLYFFIYLLLLFFFLNNLSVN